MTILNQKFKTVLLLAFISGILLNYTLSFATNDTYVEYEEGGRGALLRLGSDGIRPGVILNTSDTKTARQIYEALSQEVSFGKILGRQGFSEHWFPLPDTTVINFEDETLRPSTRLNDLKVIVAGRFSDEYGIERPSILIAGESDDKKTRILRLDKHGGDVLLPENTRMFAQISGSHPKSMVVGTTYFGGEKWQTPFLQFGNILQEDRAKLVFFHPEYDKSFNVFGDFSVIPLAERLSNKLDAKRGRRARKVSFPPYLGVLVTNDQFSGNGNLPKWAWQPDHLPLPDADKLETANAFANEDGATYVDNLNHHGFLVSFGKSFGQREKQTDGEYPLVLPQELLVMGSVTAYKDSLKVFMRKKLIYHGRYQNEDWTSKPNLPSTLLLPQQNYRSKHLKVTIAR